MPQSAPLTQQFTAVWDTGASGSVISQGVADALGLVPTGIVEVHGISGAQQTETYLVNIVLPNNVMFHGLRVTRAVLNGFDVLIGMDVISNGDLAVTNVNGMTIMTFRIPSTQAIDFVKDHHAAKLKSLIKQRPDKKRNKKR